MYIKSKYLLFIYDLNNIIVKNHVNIILLRFQNYVTLLSLYSTIFCRQQFQIFSLYTKYKIYTKYNVL